MAQIGLILRALVASPSDMKEERVIIPETIHRWNAAHSLRRSVIIHPVLWETHSIPLQGKRPQAIINEHLGAHCDFLIALFWTRFGSDTGKAPSGTVEEMNEFLAADKPVLLYFANKTVNPEDLDLEQFEKLKAFKKQRRSDGIQFDYNDINQLKEHLVVHLDYVIEKLVQQHGWDGTVTKSSFSARSKFSEDFEVLVRHITTAWEMERDSKPTSFERGKEIMEVLANELVKFASLPEHDIDDSTRAQIKHVATEARLMERHTLYLNGKRSWNRFWDAGDEIMQELEIVMKSL